MKNFLTCLFASALSVPAAAGAQSSPIPGPPTISGPSTNSGPGGFGAFNKSNMSDVESDIRNNDRLNSRGESTSASSRIRGGSSLSAASRHALDQMYPDSRAAATVRSGAFAGLAPGMVLTSDGAQVGAVQQVRTKSDGSVAVVIVESSDGRFFGVPAEKLTFNAGMLSTTMRLAGVNSPKSTATGAPSH